MLAQERRDVVFVFQLHIRTGHAGHPHRLHLAALLAHEGGDVAVHLRLAPFALGAGYLTGRPGLYVLAGGILAYFLINPLAYRLGWVPETFTAAQVPGYAFNAFNRPLGIGLLLGGALLDLAAERPPQLVAAAAAAASAASAAAAAAALASALAALAASAAAVASCLASVAACSAFFAFFSAFSTFRTAAP